MEMIQPFFDKLHLRFKTNKIMDSTTVFPQNLTLEKNNTSFKTLLLGIPIPLYVVSICSALVIIGVLWDISWHMSIGRDGLFSAPHNAIYLGAALAGLISGYQVLKTSFFGNQEEKSKMVNFWGIFYSSLGGMFCIWGGFAAGTSAPFDDWWHNTYGLDVKIFSPPHAILGFGLISIQIGAMISVLATLNQHEKIAYLSDNQNIARNNRLRNTFIFTAGMVMLTAFTFCTEFMGRWAMHRMSFYQIGAGFIPLFLLAFARASKVKWGATYIAAIYMISLWVINTTLRMFPAEPLLGPIANHVTNFQTTGFPILLVFPAIVFDYLRDKYSAKNDWILSVILGVSFVVAFFVIQWNAGLFLHESPLSRNWFFHSDSWAYNNDPNAVFRYHYTGWGTPKTAYEWVIGFFVALVLGIVSSRVGLLWGNWMRKVQR